MEQTKIKKYVIDLDTDEKHRWTNIILEHKSECLVAFSEMEKLVNLSTTAKVAKYLAKSIASAYVYFGKVLYLDELKSIAKILNVTVEKVILYQLVYEMFAACTSIGCKVNGDMIHFRTMDWDMEFLKKLTIELEFKKSGKTLFRSITWAGYIGVLTAMVPNNYSVSINYRASSGGVTVSKLIGNLKRCLGLSWPIGHLIRILLEKESDLATFKYQVSHADLIAPCYVTICDKAGKSMIIIRDNNRLVDTIESPNYVVQTNKDPGPNPESNILYSIQREKLANKILAEYTQEPNANHKDLFKKLCKRPIINEETVYMCIMIPAANVLETYIPDDYKNF